VMTTLSLALVQKIALITVLPLLDSLYIDYFRARL
jgi:hypothetical protein